MDILLMLMLANFALSTLILTILLSFAKAKTERYNSDKAAKELQKIKKQII